MSKVDLRQTIDERLRAFDQQGLAGAALGLLDALGYRSERQIADSPLSADEFKSTYAADRPFNEDAALTRDWKSIDLLFQLTDQEVRQAVQMQMLFDSRERYDNAIIESFLFAAIDLQGESYPRQKLAAATRSLNRLFPMPVIILFRHGEAITLSIIRRRLHKREESKDVLEKVTLIKDIRYADPLRAHIDILADLAMPALQADTAFHNFVGLHRAWEKALDSYALTKRFYQDVANWYHWAVATVKFPPGDGQEEEETRHAVAVIRMITRLIFVWFIKEKGLVPHALFQRHTLQALLTWNDPQQSSYYKAILQNLFFATLNTEMDRDKAGSRRFRDKPHARNAHYGVPSRYRYQALFTDPAAALRLFADIPFLNGGLFECLDRPEQDVRVDGFSDRSDNPLCVPDELFFGEEQSIDLNEVFGTRNKQYKVRGLLNIFSRYKFTVEENTPIEEEVALDPELLGQVFENLLAAYNPETRTTARKQTGSFYTPRQIVDYMVDEALIAALAEKLPGARGIGANLRGIRASAGDFSQQRDGILTPAATSSVKSPALSSAPKLAPMGERGEVEARLRQLFAYTDEPHRFSPAEVAALIDAIDAIKILDPACGSGAFPMGILHKLVFILRKLDPNNKQWKAQQLARAQRDRDLAEQMEDEKIRENAAREADARIEEIRNSFDQQDHELDYTRKLYLIENCIYGVDIQPIAVQIAKLRFFISLVADQRVDNAAPNRNVRALPNLETKFVAANSLIGIVRPAEPATPVVAPAASAEINQKVNELVDVFAQYCKVTGAALKAKWLGIGREVCAELNALLAHDPSFTPLNADWLFPTTPEPQALRALLPGDQPLTGVATLALRNPAIEQVEAELRRVRKSHFTAKTTQTKRKHREADARLRQQLSELLERDGWNHDTTAMLAQWNPYDQNRHADFFDPEWMFGVTDGFDITIGNPPYVRADAGEVHVAFRKRLEASRQYETLWEKWDLYIPFIELGYKLLKPGGVTTMIVSDAYCHAKYAQKSQTWFLQNSRILRLDFFSKIQIFDAAVRNITYFFQKG
jgi:hypothetical protein